MWKVNLKYRFLTCFFSVYGMEGIPQAFDAEEPKAKKPAPAIPPVAMPMGKN
jgi:hypothetical protein